VADVKIGDTITDDANPAFEALPGFEEIKPMVFAGLSIRGRHEHTRLRKLSKNFASTILPFSSSRKVPWRWVSDSVADSRPAST